MRKTVDVGTKCKCVKQLLGKTIIAWTFSSLKSAYDHVYFKLVLIQNEQLLVLVVFIIESFKK